MADIPVEIWQLVRDEEDHDIVLLRDESGRLLPIVIGMCEASAIWVRLSAEQAAPYLRRPWTHDLIQTVLERLGAQLSHVVIDHVADETFFATLYLSYQGSELMLDTRPSDAIALLLRMPAPLYVSEEVMAESSIAAENEEDDGGFTFDEDLPDF